MSQSDPQAADGASLALLAPASGWLWPLSAAGDPAFARGLLGPGVAIDPLNGRIVAPCDGVVLTLNPSGHAVVIRHAGGVEVMVHVGIDTVALAGRGFAPLVAPGDRVRAGEPLIEADLTRVAEAGKSLMTPVVVVAPAGAVLARARPEGPVAAGDQLYQVITSVQPIVTAEQATGLHAVARVAIGLPHGLHARPAGALAAILRETGCRGMLRAGEREAALDSVVALMRAGLARGDEVEIVLDGPGAPVALPRLMAVLSGDFAEAPPVVAATAAGKPRAGAIAGIAGAPGLAIGPCHRHRPDRYSPVEAGRGADGERAALARALAGVDEALAGAGGSAVLDQVRAAHRALLADPELARLAEAGIAAGKSAGFAWNCAVEAVADSFAGADVRLAERQADLRDLGGQVMARLGVPFEAAGSVPAGALVLADDLLPSELAGLAAAGIAGVALAGSGPTAHIAIIAAGLGLPMLTGCGGDLAGCAEGAMAILDADAGELLPDPGASALAEARQRLERTRAAAEADRAAALAPALTRDGAVIAVHANLGSAAEAAEAVRLGAEGCGLLRTEFLFQNRDDPPDEAEQAAVYRAVLNALDGRPLTLRTLDIGGDKPVRFLDLAGEANPALGLRGIRVGLAYPHLLAPQLRAALAAAAGTGPLEIMVPMVNDLGEWRRVREALGRAGDLPAALKLGMMIETPAAVLLAGQLAAEADFFSIGTNDLTQYVLAMDRTNPALSAEADPLHPAVLRAIAAVTAGAQAYGRPVSVCGAAAADPLAIPLLAGLGVTRLSVPPARVPATKRTIRALDLELWRGLARETLDLESPGAVRDFVRSHAETGEHGA